MTRRGHGLRIKSLNSALASGRKAWSFRENHKRRCLHIQMIRGWMAPRFACWANTRFRCDSNGVLENLSDLLVAWQTGVTQLEVAQALFIWKIATQLYPRVLLCPLHHPHHWAWFTVEQIGHNRSRGISLASWDAHLFNCLERRNGMTTLRGVFLVHINLPRVPQWSCVSATCIGKGVKQIRRFWHFFFEFFTQH